MYFFKNILLHGCDYNPDQWLDRPDILEKDIELMKKANINVVSVGIFSWSALEPEEGKYNFKWLSDIINKLYENGIYTFLATPSGARPKWITDKYPEVLRVGDDGKRSHFGFRHNHCYTSPAYREKVRQMNTALAKEFGHRDSVILWHISNEYRGENPCFCDKCIKAFTDYLKEKYKTINNLNHEWCNAFWSHTYSSFESIEPPYSHGETYSNHGLQIDWQEFVSKQITDFCEKEVESVKSISDLPVTTNLMDFYRHIDYFDLAKVIDIVSFDSYPAWHTGDDYMVACEAAFNFSHMRSLKKQPFLLMESTVSDVNWRQSPLKRPNMHATSSWLAVAEGANSVQYFQWRQSRNASEKNHGAVITHNGRSNTRVYKEVTALGEELKNYSDICKEYDEAKCAIVFDWNNRKNLNSTFGAERGDNLNIQSVISAFYPFFKLGINCDVIDEKSSLNGYEIIVAPMLYALSDSFSKALSDFVKSGGTLIMTGRSGTVNENGLSWLGETPHGLEEALGMSIEETDNIKTNSVNFNGKNYKANDYAEILRLTTATVLSTYNNEFYKGTPAITENTFGKGKAIYIAFNPEKELLEEILKNQFTTLKISKAYNGDLPNGVVAIKRGKYTFFLNFSENEVLLDGDQIAPYSHLIK